jgi:S-adenosylmethionine synthetase
MSSPKLFLTSESVTEGHPDKVCDIISDAVLDEILKRDPMARVACETAATTGLVIVMGEITTTCYVEIQDTVREVLRDIGYTRAKYGFDCDTCAVMVSVKEQSRDIDRGVSCSVEVRGDKAKKEEVETLGAGDQGMMVGFACNENPEMMPLTISLAHQLASRLTQVRKDGTLKYLRPDGKSQVTIEYCKGAPKRIDTVLMAAQHDPKVSHETIQRDVIEKVIRPVVPASLLDDETKHLVNATGRFAVGGPMGDAGLTGRKILVDTYGGIARHGGGAFSGKDPTKVDRSAAYGARYVAKNLVAAGLADRVEIQVSYAIGKSHPLSVAIETFDTNVIPDQAIIELINKHFDLRPGAILRDMNLRRPIYRQTASYGHFGRTDIDVPWERTDKVELLRAEAGLQ